MALFKNNTTVDTPFDNYKERQEERDRLLVGHVPESPIYMSQEAVFFLVSVVMSLYQKCLLVKDGLIWSLVVVLVVLFWSFTVRYFVPKNNLFWNVVTNSIYIFVVNIGVVFLLNLVLGVRTNPIDYVILTPFVIGFSAVTYTSHTEDYFDYKEDVLWPTVRSVVLMIIVCVICHFFNISQSFVAILLAGIGLLIMSRIFSWINKREFLFSPMPAYSIFRSVPNKNPLAFVRFFSYRLLILVGLVIASAISVIMCKIGKMQGYNFSFLTVLIFAIVGAIIIMVSDLIPFLKLEKHNSSKVSRRMKYFEYPLICAFMTFPFVSDFSYIKLLAYIIFVLILSTMFSGLMISIPRRLLFTRRVKLASGAPAILIALSLLDMVIRLLFVLY